MSYLSLQLPAVGTGWPLLLGAAALCIHYSRKYRGPSLPPGPPGLPMVGNILDVPSSDHWVKFAELGDVWGTQTVSYGRTMFSRIRQGTSRP